MFGVKNVLRGLKMKYSYLNAGVDIKKADKLTNIIKKIATKSGIGGFAGIWEHEIFSDYYFAACCDGIGTKIIPLIEKRDVKTIANDLVAMNLNDLICCGAKPMFFLDYIAANKIDTVLLKEFINELNCILEKYNCALLGGETSELGDLILRNNFDVGGFLVGAIKKQDLICKDNVKSSDIVIGLKSSGVHSNGFSLIRKLHDDKMIDDVFFDNLLTPVKIYYDIVIKLNEKKLVNSCANITGGGIISNLERAIPDNLKLKLNLDKIPKSDVFEKITKIIGHKEAYSTFNMNVGFALVVSKCNKDIVLDVASDYEPFVFGEVQ